MADDTKPPNSYSNILADLRRSFDNGTTLPLKFRVDQLNSLYRLVTDNYPRLLEALARDMRKAPMEGASYELEILKTETEGTLRALKKWVQREDLPFNLLLPWDTAFVKHDPYGVVLIIGAWNYPLLLTLQPLIGAIAAGIIFFK